MALSIEIKLDDAATLRGLRKVPSNIIQRRGEKLAEIASFIQVKALGYAYENAKYARTGKLASAIRVNVNAREGRASVVADSRIASYVRPVEFGQKPHEIPNNPWWGKRGKIHPGARGKFFMRKANLDAEINAPRRISEGVRTAIKDSGFRTR